MLLVPEDGPINLSLLSTVLSDQLVELRYVVLGPEQTAFSPGKPAEAMAEAAERFQGLVCADNGWEGELRRALGWLLNLPDERLGPMTHQLRMSFPTADIAQRRQYLELLWKETFAHWRVQDFDPEGYELKLP
jgi:hypothetical protein